MIAHGDPAIDAFRGRGRAAPSAVLCGSMVDAADRSTMEPSGLSRRRVLGGAGAALVGGAGAALVGACGSSADDTPVGGGVAGTTTVEFRGRIRQTGNQGESFACVGYLTRASGLEAASLFSSPTQNLSSSLLTASATGDLVARVLDRDVHLLDIAGVLELYQRDKAASAGPDFGKPDSFKEGKLVARFDLTLQDVLAVFAPSKGVPTLTGDMRQTAASGFGKVGMRFRMMASGLGTLVDPATLNAELEIAGNWAPV
jgi:hypothetical protein